MSLSQTKREGCLLYKIDDLINKIHCCDCLDFMREMPDKSVDLVLTDFPYGIGEDYISYDDSQDNLKKLIKYAIPEIRRISKVALITVGVGNLFLYPKPDWVLAWISSAGCGSGKWGFCCWQPIVVYGEDPYLKSGLGRRPDIFRSNESTIKNGHPCPKPIKLWSDILKRGSLNEGDIVLDPFMGSGTTCVACKKLGRNYIGIEKEPEYIKIAERRLEKVNNHKIDEWF